MNYYPESIDFNRSYIPSDIECCNRPYLVETMAAYRYECKNCNKIYMLKSINVYDCNECKVEKKEVTKMINMVKDGKRHWTTCDCGKILEYYNNKTYDLVYAPEENSEESSDGE